MRARIHIHRAVVAVLLALVFCASSGFAGEAYLDDEGYRDATWGMNRDQVRELRQDSLLLYSDEDGFVYHEKFQGIESVVVYIFEKEKLSRVVANYYLNIFNKDRYLDQYNRIESFLNQTFGNKSLCRDPAFKEACLLNPGSERIFENGLYMTVWKTDASDARLIMNGFTLRVSLILQCAWEPI